MTASSSSAESDIADDAHAAPDSADAPFVLIIDDEPGVLETVGGVLEDEGYRTAAADSGERGLALYDQLQPSIVLLDIWLPDRDGLEILQLLRARDPAATVVMMSGHGTVATAVKALRMGAHDYLEKPLAYAQVADAVRDALAQRATAEPPAVVGPRGRDALAGDLQPPPRLPIVRKGRKHQRTIKRSTVIYGLGLHSGTRTGMVLQPLPPDHGIHFLTLPADTHLPAHVDHVAETDYATTLSRDGQSIKTVEHLLSALHAAGITNLLIKVHGEIPVLDGSAAEFSKVLLEAGIARQGVPRQELVIDRCYEVGDLDADPDDPRAKRLSIEPYDGFAVTYRLRYPPPVGEQDYAFVLRNHEAYREEIAPARTFGFMKDLAMMAELGLGSGGRLDNCILVGEDDVINTELRFPDEFVRHKILDIIGDLYLLGFPLRGKVTARLTGHRDNIALLREIQRRAGSA
ncbi:MAG: UDP-3-O-acyl-N-acetylglucosamine deacetylase [Acidobacteriota bacterium]